MSTPALSYPSLRQEPWEGSLLDWIEFSQTEYFAPAALREYQRWLSDQLETAGNVVPFRLVSGRAPKGTEFHRRDGTVLYAADNEPLAGLWGLVAATGRPPHADLAMLLSSGAIPGSWPPKKKPTRFTCRRWGPAPLRLKDRGMKIAHLLDAGRNSIPVQPDQLTRRALLTLSLVNCFPMPNRSAVEFSRDGAVTADLAELPEVQSLLVSFVAELGGANLVESLFEAYGIGRRVALDAQWQRKATVFRFSVRPRAFAASGMTSTAALPYRARASGADSDGPRALGPSVVVYPDLHALVGALRTWLAAHPGVERLDDRTKGSNQRAYLRFNVQHLAGTDLVIERPTLGGCWKAHDYTGLFRLNGDTKARAARRLIDMVDSGLEPDEILEPDVTRRKETKQGPVGENPRFITAGSDDADGLYCYPV